MRIELPDDIGAALEAKAAQQGLSLEKWFRKLAEHPLTTVSYDPNIAQLRGKYAFVQTSVEHFLRRKHEDSEREDPEWR